MGHFWKLVEGETKKCGICIVFLILQAFFFQRSRPWSEEENKYQLSFSSVSFWYVGQKGESRCVALLQVSWEGFI